MNQLNYEINNRPVIPTVIPRGAKYALLLVAITQAVSLLDRQILAILAPAIKRDLQVGDAEMGLLYGTVFALFYALFSLPLGRLADGWRRTRLLSLSIFFWSLATGLAGLASSFIMLSLSRLGVGIGEAAAQPAGTSLIYDYWPKQRRGFVMAVLAAAIAVGLGGSLILGGIAADWWEQAYTASEAPFGLKGWQFAFIVAAMPGFVLSAFMWRLREPERGVMDGIPTPVDPHPFRASWSVLSSIFPGFNWISLKQKEADRRYWLFSVASLLIIVLLMVLFIEITTSISPRSELTFLFNHRTVAINPHVLQWTVIGFGLFVIINLMQNMRLTDPQAFHVFRGSPTLIMVIIVGILQMVINYGLMGFNPSFLMRTYGLSMSDTALQFGFLFVGVGIVGPLIGGPFSDWLQARFPGVGRAYVALFAMGVSPLLSLWVYTSANATDFYLRFVIYGVVLTAWMPPLYAIMYDQVLPRMRGITAGVYLISTTILGLGIGPYVVGLLSDMTGDLKLSMLCINVVGIPIVILLLFVARRAQRDEEALIARAEILE